VADASLFFFFFVFKFDEARSWLVLKDTEPFLLCGAFDLGRIFFLSGAPEGAVNSIAFFYLGLICLTDMISNVYLPEPTYSEASKLCALLS
jgi:hypothetical protein